MSGGTRTNITKLEQMEAEAKDAFDSISCKLIRGQWLQVERCLDAHMKDRFEYKWGKNIVARDVAVKVMESA